MDINVWIETDISQMDKNRYGCIDIHRQTDTYIDRQMDTYTTVFGVFLATKLVAHFLVIFLD